MFQDNKELLATGVALGVGVATVLIPWAKKELRRQKLNTLQKKVRSVEDTSSGVAEISDIIIYPVKSCKGISVKSSKLLNLGLQYDRRWMVAHVSSKGVWSFFSQRRCPGMALIGARVSDDLGSLVLSHSSVPDLSVPIVSKGEKAAPAIKIFDELVSGAVDQGDAAAEWLSKVLKKEGLRLVFMTEEGCERKIKPKYALSSTNAVSFADAYPCLLIAEASLADLNSKIDGPKMLMNRFRPNIVVKKTAIPFEEDIWGRIRFTNPKTGSEVVCENVKPCDRCILTTTNQETATQGGLKREPLKTLRTFRMDAKKEIFFGVNLLQANFSHDNILELSVGDRVTVESIKSSTVQFV